jgi:arylsulfatase A-like enzyme
VARPLGARLAGVCAVLAVTVVGCVADSPSSPARSGRPSILLTVFDTTRVDAISAYGQVGGTTPFTDALAAEGLRFTHAYANGSWTLPSHVSLFTGLVPIEHGVGWSNVWAPDALVMLAERLQAAGYETVGVSENPWIGDAFNTAQGFERFVNARDDDQVRQAVSAWLVGRDGDRPFFLFVNITDAHAPYLVREENPFVPCCFDAELVKSASKVRRFLCTDQPKDEIDVLRGLYLGGVARADAQLKEVVGQLQRAGLTRDLVTVVTSDHGEHFGEHRLYDHIVGVAEELIHVPLVIHGLPGVAPAVSDASVQLADLTPTILVWAGLPVPEGLTGRPIATEPMGAEEPRAVMAEWRDPLSGDAALEPTLARVGRYMIASGRRYCKAGDRAFGDMRAVVRYPFKLIWSPNRASVLYDLASDPGEEHDLARARPDVVAVLWQELGRHQSAGAEPFAVAPSMPPTFSQDVVDRLRALGYVPDDAEEAPGSP